MDWYRLLPKYWMQNEETDYAWDRALNSYLDKYGISAVSAHKATIGPIEVWIANWPYAYGRLTNGNKPCHGLPTVATRKRLRRAVEMTALLI